MLKLRVIASLFLMFTIAGTSVGIAQAPQAMLHQDEMGDGISEAELTNFANAYQILRKLNKESEKEMVAIVQENDLELKRFNEIHKASLDPEYEVSATEKELEKHALITAQLEKKQLSFQKKMEEVILDHGLTMNRYEEIAVSLQKDPSLQKRLEKAMKG